MISTAVAALYLSSHYHSGDITFKQLIGLVLIFCLAKMIVDSIWDNGIIGFFKNLFAPFVFLWEDVIVHISLRKDPIKILEEFNEDMELNRDELTRKLAFLKARIIAIEKMPESAPFNARMDLAKHMQRIHDKLNNTVEEYGKKINELKKWK